VFLAGDAAHIHPPLGGQGMNLGIHDAMNLGWKLTAVLTAKAPVSLLDTYQDERHPVAARVLDNTRAQSALLEPGDNAAAMYSRMRQLLRLPDANEMVAAEISGLDISYGDGDGVVGRRVPDVALLTAAGPRRLHELLRRVRPVLLDLRPGGAAWPATSRSAEKPTVIGDVVDYVAADCPVAQWRLPVLGWRPVPPALLIRPDGYVAWASPRGSDDGLAEAVGRIGAGRSPATA
jgi:FAD binding domain